MVSISKIISLLSVVILAVSSLIMVESASAQSIAKPSIPEFTLRYIDLSYNVPPIYGTDQYTGKTIITQDSYHIDNRSLQFIIKNKPFTSTTDTSGNQTGLYYNFRIKGAYGTEWDYYPFATNGWTTSRYGGANNTASPADLAQSNTEYTTITIRIPGVYRVPADAQIEAQAQALIGYMVPSDYMLAGHVYIFTGQYGDWSDPQTVTVGQNLASTTLSNLTTTPNPSTNQTAALTPNQTAMPTITNSTGNLISIPLSTFIAVVAVFLVIIVALSLMLFRRHRKSASLSK